MIFILTITAILTASYKDKIKPTTLTFNDVNKLLMDYTVTNPILYEKIKKFMPEEIFYINGGASNLSLEVVADGSTIGSS